MARETATVRNAAGEVVATYDATRRWCVMSVTTMPMDVVRELALATFGHPHVARHSPWERSIEQPAPNVFVTRATFSMIPGRQIGHNHWDYTDTHLAVHFTWEGVADYTENES